jgi:hypothetical protein
MGAIHGDRVADVSTAVVDDDLRSPWAWACALGRLLRLALRAMDRDQSVVVLVLDRSLHHCEVLRTRGNLRLLRPTTPEDCEAIGPRKAGLLGYPAYAQKREV